MTEQLQTLKISRESHPADTIIPIGNIRIGEGSVTMIAGPCTIESEEQLLDIARSVRSSGAHLLRGGTFKVRTSPYDFPGLGEAGISILLKAKRETGLPVISEIIDTAQIKAFEDIDIIQIGARSMQNVTLLKAVGELNKPILLKRGLCATIDEFLYAAEYLMLAGCDRIILCERGIRTFETATRNTLDLSAVPLLKQRTHLPVIVDPSHATGNRTLIPAMCKAAIAAGADGLMLEVHPHPEKALCDGPQAVSPDSFSKIMDDISRLAEFENKEMF